MITTKFHECPIQSRKQNPQLIRTSRLKIREIGGEELTTKWVKNYLKPIHVHAVVYHRGCTWQGNRHDASNASIRQLYAWFRQKPTFCLGIQFLLRVGPICFLSVIREKKVYIMKLFLKITYLNTN